MLKKNKGGDYTKQGLCAFTNSAMNVEYVFIIIMGINKFHDEQNYELISVDKKTKA